MASSIQGSYLVSGFPSKVCVPGKQKFSPEVVGWGISSGKGMQLGAAVSAVWSVNYHVAMSYLGSP